MTEGCPFEVFRSVDDDRVIGIIESNSVRAGDLCTWGRGEEMAKSGLYWICPSCLRSTVPGKKLKGGGLATKSCPECGALLRPDAVRTGTLVVDHISASHATVPWIDGDDIVRRYQVVKPSRWLRVDLPGWPYKGASLYTEPKILIRQAGVGLLATVDRTGARCPQSVYFYRVDVTKYPKIAIEYLLAALLSAGSRGERDSSLMWEVSDGASEDSAVGGGGGVDGRGSRGDAA